MAKYHDNPEILITLQNFINIGGLPEKGLKIFTNPNPDGVSYMLNGNYYTEHTKFYTLDEITNDGVRVDENEYNLGTGWLFLTIPTSEIELKK